MDWTPLEACAFGSRLVNRSLFIPDRCLLMITNNKQLKDYNSYQQVLLSKRQVDHCLTFIHHQSPNLHEKNAVALFRNDPFGLEC